MLLFGKQMCLSEQSFHTTIMLATTARQEEFKTKQKNPPTLNELKQICKELGKNLQKKSSLLFFQIAFKSYFSWLIK